MDTSNDVSGKQLKDHELRIAKFRGTRVYGKYRAVSTMYSCIE
jgi:hypothetical protein